MNFKFCLCNLHVHYDRRCARNCFQCPICQNTLTAVANPDIPPRDPAASEDVTKPAVNPYHLFCGVCRWDSQEVGITFEKPTSLASTTLYSTHISCNIHLLIIDFLL
jgi:hypothetical protein